MVIAFNMEQFVSNHLEHLNFIHPLLPSPVRQHISSHMQRHRVDAIHFWVGAEPFRMVIASQMKDSAYD